MQQPVQNHSLAHVSQPSTETLAFDVILIGGGIAGLWILNRLCNAGYNAVLLEEGALGTGQTIASQGMIHGGIKYTLAGALSGASEAIADMPDHWRSCLAGTADVDCSQTKILSDHFYMWSTEKTVSRMAAFFASKALRGRVNALDKKQFPAVFKDIPFKGALYQLVDSVIDTPSLLTNLAANMHGRIFSIDWKQTHLVVNDNLVAVEISAGNKKYILEAQQFIFTAGKGNAGLLNMISADKPEMQTRPLQQVMVKHKNNHALYAHCIGADSIPRLTISSHRCYDGDMCWYLGGQLAEKGVGKNPRLLMREAKTELEQLFPWLDWQQALWSTLCVDRAEPKQKNLVRPDKAFIDRVINTHTKPFTNALVAWPTKLTLSPNLGNETLTLFNTLNVCAGKNNSDPIALAFLPTPAVALSPWETAGWVSSDALS